MPDNPRVEARLATTDSVSVTIQPFIDESGELIYHANVAFLDSKNQEQYVELKAGEPLQLLNYLNDALRYKEVSLARVTGEVPPLPPQKDATRKTEKH